MKNHRIDEILESVFHKIEKKRYLIDNCVF